MLRLIHFDTSADTATVAAEVQASVRTWPGVRRVAVYQAAEGQPRYLVQIETEDVQDAAVASRLQASLQQYAADLWSVSHRAYHQIG